MRLRHYKEQKDEMNKDNGEEEREKIKKGKWKGWRVGLEEKAGTEKGQNKKEKEENEVEKGDRKGRSKGGEGRKKGDKQT